ncbi:MAG: SDR family oxidoreductase [Candidatus Nitrosocosmicus sp.]|nr:SDR family oxidoreductase [Candidatus Nitrosocosmicus sp.]MDN5868962.1 SDR family oxidoreductase [Candidatus Nitrosocosmicus sp.]
MAEDKLKEKIAVVTGGASGIGLATAKRFVSEGAYVFVIDRNQKDLDEAVSDIGKNVSTGIQCDVSNLKDLDKAYEIIKDRKGHIDILFANAGIIEFVPFGKISEDNFDRIFSINVKGLLFSVQKALPIFTDGGSIILTSSVGASTGAEELSLYHSTKAAIRSFARCWILDLKDRKIRVNAISPGTIDTPFVYQSLNKEESEQFFDNVLKSNPMGRMGSPDEVAKAVLFLASEDSSYITGIELFVDGGVAQI